MVTLQILVLSFLVRIPVAQLKRLSVRGSFFLLYVLQYGSVSSSLSSCNENKALSSSIKCHFVSHERYRMSLLSYFLEYKRHFCRIFLFGMPFALLSFVERKGASTTKVQDIS